MRANKAKKSPEKTKQSPRAAQPPVDTDVKPAVASEPGPAAQLSNGFTISTGSQITIGIAIAVLVAAALLVARLSRSTDAVRVNAANDLVTTELPVATVMQPTAKPAMASTKPAKKIDVSHEMPPAPATAETAKAVTVSASMEPAKATNAEPIPELEGLNPEPVTVTGCLASDNESFWLNDTAGDDVPMARSWKTGFFKKRPARIEVVDASHALKLSSHLGQRVEATGTLVDREMRARSVRRVAATCN